MISSWASALDNYKTPRLSSSIEPYCRSSQSCPLDLQYQICSRYIKMTAEQFYQKELELIHSSEKFIEKINQNLALKDISTTQESLTMDTVLEEEDPFSCQSKSRILLRKSQSNSSIRRTESGMTEALREAKKKCSEKTSAFFSNMTGEYRRLKEKQSIHEKHQKDLKRLEQKYQIKQQEVFMLKKRISDLQNQHQNMQRECQTLKTKLDSTNQDPHNGTLSRSKSNDHLLPTQGTPFQRLKKYLQQKQLIIFKRQKQIRAIHEKISSSIYKSVSQEGCVKCCELIKRIKQSIMKYRAYLQDESSLATDLYDKYKRSFL